MSSMKENIIYFAMGFKSYEIERRPTINEDWIEWTERGIDFIRRITFNKKTMLWLCGNLKEASKERQIVKRWKSKDQYS